MIVFFLITIISSLIAIIFFTFQRNQIKKVPKILVSIISVIEIISGLIFFFYLNQGLGDAHSFFLLVYLICILVLSILFSIYRAWRTLLCFSPAILLIVIIICFILYLVIVHPVLYGNFVM